MAGHYTCRHTVEGRPVSKPAPTIVDCLRSYFSNPHLESVSDSELLRRYIETSCADAFTCLVHRHGPMVFGLARRILRDYQLAEDVFQATFLILGRKARAIRGRQSVAGWLHSIAFVPEPHRSQPCYCRVGPPATAKRSALRPTFRVSQSAGRPRQAAVLGRGRICDRL
jgi:hypothetical protein